MIKIRLHGVADEMQEYVELLRKDKKVKVLSESSPYKDRGTSEYSRIYLDVELVASKRLKANK